MVNTDMSILESKAQKILMEIGTHLNEILLFFVIFFLTHVFFQL